MKPDWEDLKTVLHLVKGGSLSNAARSLGINYTTVARRIASIESELDQTLFQRLPEGYRPTEAGLNVANAAEAMESHSNSMIRSLTAAQEDLTGSLTITAPQLLVWTHLAEVLRRLREKHPQIELIIRATNETLNLNVQQADVAIRISNTPDDALVGQRLAHQHILAYATPEIAKKIVDNPDDTFDWVGMNYWKSLPKGSVKEFPNARIAYRFDDMVAVVGATVAGLGVARLPMFLGDSNPALVRVPVLSAQPYWDIWVLTHKDMRNAPKVSAFKEILVPYFKAHKSDFWDDSVA